MLGSSKIFRGKKTTKVTIGYNRSGAKNDGVKQKARRHAQNFVGSEHVAAFISRAGRR